MNSLPNILIVDDSDLNLFYLAAVIKNINVNVIQASSGIEALEKTKGMVLALAILDVRMPGMSGYDLALRMNEVRFEEKVPIIFLTASHIDEIELFKGYVSGAVDYLFKPVNNNVLLSKINVFLDLFNQKQAVTQKATELKLAAKELRRVNAELKKSEERYRSYVDNAPDGVFVTDEKGKYLEVNEAACRITGFSKAELLTMSISDLNPLETVKDGLEHFQKVVEVGVSKSDLLFRHKDGSKRWWSKESVKLSGTSFLVFAKDINKRKETEKALAANQVELEIQNSKLIQALIKAEVSSEKYTELYELAPSGYFTLSKDKIIEELNLSGSSIIGRDRSELMHKHFNIFISKLSLPVFNAFFQNVFMSKQKEVCEIMLTPVKGQSKYVHIEGMIIGNGTRCLINVVDITERKIAEQALKISEEKYKTIINASPDGILLIDLNGVVTEVSEIGLEIFGAETRDDLIGKEFSRFVPFDENNTIKEIIEKTMSEGLVQNIGLKMRKINQTVFAGEVSATLIQDPDGVPLSFMIIIRDISQRKRIETKQLHADRMANLGEMASGIAHEINQPLNIISMVMDKIIFESDKTEIIDVEFLRVKSNKIFENIIRIRNIIDHIRAFSRSQDDFILTAFDLNASIESAVSMIMEQFKHLGINLNLQLEKQISQILGNTYKFEQVIINLLNNAKDAVIEKKNLLEEYSELQIGIKSHQEDQFIIVEVTDNGIGISKEDINNIILPFYTTKDEGKGTGIGLSICYQIIKELNGTIDITSNSSQGTKIKLVLDTLKKK